MNPPLQSQTRLSPAEALQLSQQAPAFLRRTLSAVSHSTLTQLMFAPESLELWTQHENLFLSCLRTGDDKSAHECLKRLSARFGDDNERLLALRGLLKEAEARSTSDLEVILKEYEQILESKKVNIPIMKRRIILLRSLGRNSDAVAALIQFLDFCPVDPEAWTELADIYLAEGMYFQAVFAMEEVLLIAPNAWNIHARLGEIQYMAATASGSTEDSSRKSLAEALKRFSRSVELCDDYLRGYYGLKLATTRLLQQPAPSGSRGDTDGFVLPDQAAIERLDELATAKLAAIIRRYSSKERLWQGYDEAEIAAARELLASA